MKKFFMCTCQSEGFSVNKETSPFEDGNEFSFSFWKKGFSNKDALTLKDKLRWVNQILFHGVPWTDEVILNDNDIRRLITFLQDLTDDEEREL